jgi:putative glycosyltransferase (TIGR04372 family)
MNAIVMMLSCHALGELVVRNLYLCALSRHFPSSPVYAIVDPTTPDQAMSLLLNPRIDYMLVADRMSNKFLSGMSWLQGEWSKKHEDLAYPLLFVPPNGLTLGWGMFSFDGEYSYGPETFVMNHCIGNTLFKIPSGIADDSERQLVALGLRRDQWFITLHAREDGYRTGSSGASQHPRSIRHIDRYTAAIDYIISQGGQVVRLGDPTATKLPERRGFIDLMPIRNSFLLQAYACSRSRFLLGCDSGPTTIATGFNTPTALVNMVNNNTSYTAPSNHILATKGFRLDDGRILWDGDAHSQGLMDEALWYQRFSSLEELSERELCRVCELMIERTPRVSGWVERVPSSPDFVDAERRISAEEMRRRNSWYRTYLSDICDRSV